MDNYWLVHATLVTPRGLLDGALRVKRRHVAAIWPRAPRGARTVDLGGAYVASGFIDLHVWGDPATIARESPKGGTTSFLTTLGPEPQDCLLEDVARRMHAGPVDGAECIGVHLEGPFVNPVRSGALPRRDMHAPTIGELRRLSEAAGGRIKLITLAPELRGATTAIRWCRRNRIVTSLGHSDADARTTMQAVDQGAEAITHVFNGMGPFHHRRPSLVDVALTDPRLTTMVILDGVHVSPSAFRLLYRIKGAGGVALVTDSVRYQGWDVVRRNNAYYTRRGLLAGSCLTMMQAVRNAVEFGGVSVTEAVRMATETPARLLGIDRTRGTLGVGRRANLVAFDRRFRTILTVVGGRIVYQRGP